ncbi:MAG TPA: 4-alpha-glucanotransferase [Verrucomicrobiota bacterium]|nr:4-alpha-glucanotransferase [Verrucomicrobiota bacterium]HNU49648.1 4-alpha-glucanotransferase [Verrucomicrobiota bacterium]
MTGRRRSAPAESLLGVLRALGVAVQHPREVSEALRLTRVARARRVVEPVQVQGLGVPAAIPVSWPGRAASARVCGEWRLENGEVFRHEARLDRLPEQARRRVEGEVWVRSRLPVPRRLPMGYHRLLLECGDARWQVHVLAAPERCFRAIRQQRVWGLFAPLYALHSKRSWGAGDFTDLEELMRWLGRRGGRVLATLPLLPAFLDGPPEPSPYSPVSRLFWNEFYVDLERVPELAACAPARQRIRSAAFQARLRSLRQAGEVDFGALMALKRHVLEPLSRSFFARPSARLHAFEQFLDDHPHLADYARFRAVQEQRGRVWRRWPARLRQGSLGDDDCQPPLREYHLYVQWLAHTQLARFSEQARRRGVALYLDMPLGTHRDGYDAWRHQNLFALDASGGAPPDPVFPQAQNWGFAPLHPERTREEGHAYVRACIRHHLEQARMLRLDHVMGLHRLYWIPPGVPATQGVYVTYPADEFYAILSIESRRHRASIVGENLGTVPPVVNRGLVRHGVSGMFVVQAELRPSPGSALRPVPGNVVASLNTHDMPPFAAFWAGSDIADWRDLNRLGPRRLQNALRFRSRIRQSVLRFLRRRMRAGDSGMDSDAVFRRLVEHLAASRARWVLLNLEDLWGETMPQNTPGTSLERVNWRRKAQFSLEAFEQKARDGGILMALNRLRQVRHSVFH